VIARVTVDLISGCPVQLAASDLGERREDFTTETGQGRPRRSSAAPGLVWVWSPGQPWRRARSLPYPRT
jgi:hypothetical protein